MMYDARMPRVGRRSMGREIPPEASIKASESVIPTNIEGNEVLIDLNTNTYHTLSEVGSYIWTAIQTPRTVSELPSLVAEKPDTSIDVEGGTVVSVVYDFAAEGLVEVDTAA